MKKPDCYKCVHRQDIPSDCHSQCQNTKATVRGSPHGIRNGWFVWPFNFDPVWLVSCDGFEAKNGSSAGQEPGKGGL